jgi:hypothetical protein
MHIGKLIRPCDATLADWHIAALVPGRDKSGPYAIVGAIN